MPQFFKGDAYEMKFYNSGAPTLQAIDLDRKELFDGCYDAGPLGDALYVTGRTPLSNAIAQSIFRSAFNEIFKAFAKVGTFNAYLTVFKKIFGDDVLVTFASDNPGELSIDIVAEGVELSHFITRYIEDNQYVFDKIVDHEGNNIVFQTIKGFTSQYELEQMLFEMVPDGIYTNISLTLGGD